MKMIAELTKAEEEMCKMHEKGICDGFSRKCLHSRLPRLVAVPTMSIVLSHCSLCLTLRAQKDVAEKLDATKRKL